jgi:dihydroneopterin aldolase
VPDVIEIRGLRALGVIGVNPEEKARAQPFEIDLDLEADLSKAGETRSTTAVPSPSPSR